MADDIVARLRNAEAPKDGSELLCDLADEAADEIQRLREQNDYLKANVEMLLVEARAVRGGDR